MSKTEEIARAIDADENFSVSKVEGKTIHFIHKSLNPNWYINVAANCKIYYEGVFFGRCNKSANQVNEIIALINAKADKVISDTELRETHHELGNYLTSNNGKGYDGFILIQQTSTTRNMRYVLESIRTKVHYTIESNITDGNANVNLHVTYKDTYRFIKTFNLSDPDIEDKIKNTIVEYDYDE